VSGDLAGSAFPAAAVGRAATGLLPLPMVGRLPVESRLASSDRDSSVKADH
jgi:hypothetical protein